MVSIMTQCIHPLFTLLKGQQHIMGGGYLSILSPLGKLSPLSTERKLLAASLFGTDRRCWGYHRHNVTPSISLFPVKWALNSSVLNLVREIKIR